MQLSCLHRAGAQAQHAACVHQESDIDAVPKAEAHGNGHWQGAVRTLYEEDEDDAVNSPQDTHPKVGFWPIIIPEK